MVTVLEAQHDVVEVRGMRAADVDNLNVLVLHEFFVSSVSVVNTKLGCESSSRIHSTASNSDDL